MIINVTLIVLMSITFVLVFLFVKTIDKRKWLTFIVSLAMTPLVYFYAVYPMINIFSNYHHQKYFSSEVWKEQPNLRYELSDNMINSDVLIGKTKTDIEALLGSIEWYTWDSITNAHNIDKWNYSLGQKPGVFTEHKECIEIVFKNNQVIKLNAFQETILLDDKQ